MTRHTILKALLAAPVLLGVAACGGGGSGSGDGAAEEAPNDGLTSFAERETFAGEVITEQQQIVAAGAADPADLPASASYAGGWAMSLDPEGDTEIIGGSVALEADFAGGTLTGDMVQEVLPGADGTLSIENGQITDAQLAGDLRGSLDDPEGGSIGVDTGVDGFFSDNGAQGTMSGTATRGGDTVGAQGAFGAATPPAGGEF